MAILFDTGIFSVNDTDGSVGVGWKLNFYRSGTSTRRDTYPTPTDSASRSNANANPVVSDAGGRFPAIWLPDNSFKVVLTDENDVVKVTRDPAVGLPSGALSLVDLGGDPTGVADSTTAIQAWLDEGADGASLYLPRGEYKFTSALGIAGHRLSILGEGGGGISTLRYAGAATNIDLLTIGDGISDYFDCTFSGFSIRSDTTMTAGCGLHVKQLGRSYFYNVDFYEDDGAKPLWHGIWFDQVDKVTYLGFWNKVQQTCIRVNGGPGAPGGTGGGLQAGLYLDKGKCSDSTVGIHIGGAFGGFNMDDVDSIANTTNVLIDTSLVANRNREVYFGPDATMDGGDIGLDIADTLSQTNTFVKLDGAWVASSTTAGIKVRSGVGATILFSGGIIYNHTADGLLNQSADTEIMLNGTAVRYNGVGIRNTAANDRVRAMNVLLTGNTVNTSGRVEVSHPAIQLDVANGANVAFPSVSSGVLSVCQRNNGNKVAVYILGGGGATLVSSTSSAWEASTTTPAGGKASVAFNGTGYSLYNNIGGALSVGYTFTWLNSGT